MPHTPQKHHLETVTKNFHGPGAFAIRKPKVAILVGIIICVWGMLFFPHLSFAFSDVSEDHPNYEAIEWAKENGIVKGFEDGTFRPEQRVTRAELIKIIFGAHQKTRGNKKNCFPDVKEEWFSPYVCKAKNEKFINGFPDGNFKPHKNISFVAAAKIIANVMSDEEIVEDEEIWYANYVQFLSDKKAIPVSILELDKEITRGEVVEIVWRLKEDKKNQKSRWFENGNFYYRIEAGIIYAGVEKIGIGNRGGKYFDFQPTEIDGFEVLGFDYWKNKDEIYYGNLSLQQNILNNTNIHLNNIDAETFEVLNHIYAKDKNNIYYKDSYIYDNNVDEDGNVSDLHHTSVYVWENIDNEGIEILGNFYAKYNGEIYVTKFVGRNNTQPIVRKIESADPTTFQIIENSNEYDAEDKNAYYQNGVMVKEKEIKTQKIDLSFENHDKSGELRCSCRHNGCCTIRYSLPYFISNGSVYYLEDGVSLEFINLTYEETMEQAKKIENADPATFKIIKDSDEYDAQDKNHKYLHGKIVE